MGKLKKGKLKRAAAVGLALAMMTCAAGCGSDDGKRDDQCICLYG